MYIFRITRTQYANDLTGNGARLYGGRWNSEGRFALYSASTRALALLETLAHTSLALLKEGDFALVTLEVPDTVAHEAITANSLPRGWNAWNLMRHTRKLGDAFLQQGSHLLLRVPSVLLPEEHNWVLNPLHPAMKQVHVAHIRPLQLDNRLLTAV
mgnify:CR=1 FL=1